MAEATSIAIRAGRDSDAEQLIELVRSAWSEYPDIVLEVEAEVPELRAIATFFAERAGKFWVAERQGRVVGSVGTLPAADPRGVELRKLYVARAERRQGLGSRLCSLVEDEARDQRAAFVDLWTDTRFTDAHRLYEARGYVRGPTTRELHDLSCTVEFYYRKELRG